MLHFGERAEAPDATGRAGRVYLEGAARRGPESQRPTRRSRRAPRARIALGEWMRPWGGLYLLSPGGP